MSRKHPYDSFCVGDLLLGKDQNDKLVAGWIVLVDNSGSLPWPHYHVQWSDKQEPMVHAISEVRLWRKAYVELRKATKL